MPALEGFQGPKLTIVTETNTEPTSLQNLLGDLPHHQMTGISHWLIMDRPKEFNRLMDEFLARWTALWKLIETWCSWSKGHLKGCRRSQTVLYSELGAGQVCDRGAARVSPVNRRKKDFFKLLRPYV